MATCCPIVELRQYTLHPGKRDGFIRLFEDSFVESQEAVGIDLIGHFRDLDDPDRFVWMRGFPGMAERPASLSAFYDGALWKSLRNDANASINDSDNVLLLRPALAESGVPAPRALRSPLGATAERPGVVLAMLHYLDADMAEPFTDFFEAKMKPELTGLGMAPIAQFVAETSENNFKRLPVREHDRVFVWLARFDSLAACDAHIARYWRAQAAWREGAPDPILHQLARKAEMLRLKPAARSALAG